MLTINLPNTWLKEIQQILSLHLPEAKAWVFGSRVSGTAKQWSDCDIALLTSTPLNWQQLERLKDAFSESNLPIMVDLSDWSKLPTFLQEKIKQQHIEIQ
ncbi:MAG: nucleotidyltransferase domain-containing protein [Gammaproteobacteria bacterium]|nr:nucleotidyltransferase domain-containing protein [Gammaproteobacteria bacterium]